MEVDTNIESMGVAFHQNIKSYIPRVKIEVTAAKAKQQAKLEDTDM